MARLTDAQVRGIFLRRRRIAAAILICILGFTAFFAYKSFERARYWSRHAEEPIRQWMTVGYVARSHHVRPQILKAAIGLPPEMRDRRPLVRIAQDQNRPVEELIVILNNAVAEEHLRHPPDAGGGP